MQFFSPSLLFPVKASPDRCWPQALPFTECMAPLPLPQALSEVDDYDGHSLSTSLTAEAAAHQQQQQQQRGKREGSVRSRVKSLTASLHRVSEVREGGTVALAAALTAGSMGETNDQGVRHCGTG